MKLAAPSVGSSATAVVVQPSYIPWRGYFDLIRRADVFVFYDDVQYDKHGWRNRNRIKTAAGLRWLTIPIHAKGNTTAHVPINHIGIDWTRDWRRSHLEQLRHAYHKAPYYARYVPLLEAIYAQKPALLADFTIPCTMRIAQALGIEGTRFVRSSTLDACGTKTDRLLQVLQQVRAAHYISGPSARAYLDEEAFAAAGISLEYAAYDYAPYDQLHPPYEPGVSILDLLFMTGPRALSYLR